MRRYLKQLIKHQKLVDTVERLGYDLKMTLPGEPLIYSIKYRPAKRFFDNHYFRNKKWGSIIKCHFRAYLKSGIPVVLIVRFYVSAPSYAKVTKKQLKEEKTPAAQQYEICDYLLSFLEMIRMKLILTYCQIAKIDAEKYYSNNPRTVFQFMSWENYVQFFQDQDPNNSKAKSIRANRKMGPLQSNFTRHERDEELCDETNDSAKDNGAAEGTAACGDSLPNTSCEATDKGEADRTRPDAPRKKTRRRQS